MIFSGGGYSEQAVYRGLQTFILSMYIPIFSKFEWKKNPYKIVYAVLFSIALYSIQLIIPLGEAEIYSTIYIDGALAALFAYIVFEISTNQELDMSCYLQLSVSLAFLLLTKQMSIFFYLLAIFIFAVNVWIIPYRRNQIFNIKKTAGLLVSVFIIPLLFNGSWTFCSKKAQIEGQFSLKAIIKSLFEVIFKNGGEGWQNAAYHNFLDKLMNTQIVSRPVLFTYWQMMIILGILLYLV